MEPREPDRQTSILTACHNYGRPTERLALSQARKKFLLILGTGYDFIENLEIGLLSLTRSNGGENFYSGPLQLQ